MLTEQEKENQLITVSRMKNNNEKLSWKRKYEKMQTIINELDETNKKIQSLENEREEVYSRILVLRNTMIKECIHPLDHLIHKNDYIECKFCNVKLSLPKEKI